MAVPGSQDPSFAIGSKFTFNNTSYSGADIKIVVNIYNNKGLSNRAEGKIQEEINKAQDELILVNREISKLEGKLNNAKPGSQEWYIYAGLFNELTGRHAELEKVITDMQQGVADLVKSMGAQTTTKVLAEAQTLSISTFRDKQAVRSCGSVYPKGFCLPESAMILTRDRGLVSIKDIHQGDIIESSFSSWGEVDGIWKQANQKKCLKIKTIGNKELEASYDHPIMTKAGWKKAGDLSLNDKLSITLSTPSSQDDYPIDDWIIKMLGLFIGDGSNTLYKDGTEHSIQLTINDQEMHTIGAEVENLLNVQDIPFTDHKQPGCVNRRISPCLKGYNITDWKQRRYNMLHYWLKQTGLYEKKAANKFIPGVILSNFSRRQVVLFLQFLLSTDGGYSISTDLLDKDGNPKEIEFKYSTASKELAKGIGILLTKCGIDYTYSIEKKKGKQGGRPHIISNEDSHQIKISHSGFLYKFFNNIGVFGKNDRVIPYLPVVLRRLRDTEFALDINMQDFQKRVSCILKKQNRPVKKFCSKFNLYNYKLCLTPCRALAVCDQLNDQDFLREVLVMVTDQIQKDRMFIYKDIKEISDIGEHDVYDLSVPSTENFIANQILVHNTRGPREIAGTIVFTVFDEHVLYRFLEAHPSDFDAASGLSSALMDQLPPVDITVVFANEYGTISRMGLFGVEFIDEGQTMSIEDIITENVVSFVARDLDPMRKVGQRNRDEVSNTLRNELAKKASDLLLEDDYQAFKSKLNPYQRFNYRRNPFI